MKNIIRTLFVLGVLTSFNSFGQKLPGVDKSTLDVSYLPHNYAHDGGDGPVARVLYSRPAKKDREVFGKLVPFGKVWRVGANETTEIEFFKDVKFGGKEVKAGVYSLFAIPEKDSWTIILNTQKYSWGAYSYKEDKDVLRITVPVSENKDVVENFTIMFSSKGKSGTMNFYWDSTIVEVPIEF